MSKNYKFSYNILFTIIIISLSISCKKEKISLLPSSFFSNIITDTTFTINNGKLTCGGYYFNNTDTASLICGGICLSTDTLPTIDDVCTEQRVGIGYFTSEIKNLSPQTKYYFRAYIKSNSAIKYGQCISFYTYEIGQLYEGGIIFYIYDNGKHGLISSLNDVSTAIVWTDTVFPYVPPPIMGSWPDRNNVATSIKIGTGKQNTDSIVARFGDGNYAAKACYDLVENGKDDWYLPSFDELYLMYFNLSLNGIGNITYDGYYWSSTGYGSNNAPAYKMNNNYSFVRYKSDKLYARAIRSF